MELFSRRRWTTGSTQQSNRYGILPSMCFIIFLIRQKTQQLTTWPIQPSSPTKELHGVTLQRPHNFEGLRHNYFHCSYYFCFSSDLKCRDSILYIFHCPQDHLSSSSLSLAIVVIRHMSVKYIYLFKILNVNMQLETLVLTNPNHFIKLGLCGSAGWSCNRKLRVQVTASTMLWTNEQMIIYFLNLGPSWPLFVNLYPFI